MIPKCSSFRGLESDEPNDEPFRTCSSMYNPYDPFLANSAALAQLQASGGLAAADPRLQNLAAAGLAAAGAPTVSTATGVSNAAAGAQPQIRGPQAAAAGFNAAVGMNNAAALGLPPVAAAAAHNHFSLQAANLAANQAAAAAYGAAGLPAA